MQTFDLAQNTDSNKIFLINRSELNYRIDPIYYNSVNKLYIVNNTKYPIKKLGEVTTMQRGRFGHRPRNDPDYFDGPYPFIQTGNIVEASKSNGKINYTQTLNELGLSTSRLFNPNVLVITIAANIGDTAILDYPACFPDSLIALHPKGDINIFYLNYCLKFIKPYIESLAPQSAQKNINLQQLNPIPVIVPPKHVQESVVEILTNAYKCKQLKESKAKSLLESIDYYLLEELGIKLPDQDKRLGKCIFTLKFSEITGKRFDPDYNSKYEFLISQKGNYEFVRLGDLIVKSPQYGANEEAIAGDSDSDIRYIRITDIDEIGNLKEKGWKTAKNTDDRYLLNYNDLLFARSGSVGKCYIHKEIQNDAIFAGYLIRFVLNINIINPDYLFYYCNSSIYNFWVSAIQRPAVQANINSEEFKSMPIPLPPINRQNEIANHIQNIRSHAKTLQEEAIQVLEAAKQEVERMILGE